MDVALQALQQAYSDQGATIERLEETLSQKLSMLDNIGWSEIGGYNEGEGPTLQSLQNLIPKLRELAVVNPLHVRGKGLRFSYIFGRPLEFINVKTGTQKVIDDPDNKTALFSMAAYETNNSALFTDGNLVILKNITDKAFIAVPMQEISSVVVDPDDASRIRFVQRSWTRYEDNKSEVRTEWIPLARYKKRVVKLPAQIGNVKVAQDKVVYVRRANSQTGWTWGVPDSLPAMVWALAYSKYLQDNAKLVTALSMIAWSLTQGTKAGANAAAARIVGAGSGVGGTAVNSGESHLSSVGVPSAQVNMNNGQPLAAMVATSFGVSVIALLSSPGATGGSYGAATTLSDPTIRGFEALQNEWLEFYTEILRDAGSPDAEVRFAPISPDPAYREAAAVETAVELGLVHRDEGRAALLDILSIPELHKGLPPDPKEVEAERAEKAAAARVTSGQGVAGAVAGGTEQGVSNHDADTEGQA